MSRIKGIGVIGIVKALRSRRDQVEALLPVELRHYLHEQILLSNWYAEDDYLALLRLYVQTWPELSFEEVGKLGAREALQSIYRNILVGGVESAARRMKVNWRNYHDSGELSVETRPGTVQIRVSEYGIQAPELCQLNTGYFGELLHLAGANIVACRKDRCVCRSSEDCVWEFDWRVRVDERADS